MSVSIIIPTQNRSDALRRTLFSILELDWPPQAYEILVVDNGSADRTRQVVEEMASRYRERAVRYSCEPMPGLLSGRHRGALEAKGDICAYLDDDVRVGRHWLRGLDEAFRDPHVALAGGPSSPVFESDPPAWLATFYSEDEHGRHCGFLSLFDDGSRTKEIDPCFVWGLNFAIRRKALFDLGGFHPDSVPKSLQRFQGDGETGLSLKLRRAGLKALYHPEASVQHEVPASRLTIEYFEQRAYFQGVCDSYTQIRTVGAGWKRQRAPSLQRRALKMFFDLCRRPHRKSREILGAISRLAFLRRWGSGIRDRKFLFRDQSTEIGAIRSRVDAAYRAGYIWHQDEVHRDPELLKWVLKPDYLDYRLPDGWEKYLDTEQPRSRMAAGTPCRGKVIDC